MPELPEVEHFLSRIKGKVENKKVEKVEVLDEEFIRLDPSAIKSGIEGHKVLACERRGKFIIVSFDSGFSLIFHMGMTGEIRLELKGQPRPKHLKFYLLLNNGEEIRYICIRKLGMVKLVVDKLFFEIKTLNRMGVEPLGGSFTSETLKYLVKKSPISSIKPFLLDQGKIAGIGNIYADEILFRAKIHPKTKLGHLETTQIRLLHRCIRQTLDKAIRDYGSISGSRFWFINARRPGSECPRCKTAIRHIIVANRRTFFCPQCQHRID